VARYICMRLALISQLGGNKARLHSSLKKICQSTNNHMYSIVAIVSICSFVSVSITNSIFLTLSTARCCTIERATSHQRASVDLYLPRGEETETVMDRKKDSRIICICIRKRGTCKRVSSDRLDRNRRQRAEFQSEHLSESQRERKLLAPLLRKRASLIYK